MRLHRHFRRHFLFHRHLAHLRRAVDQARANRAAQLARLNLSRCEYARARLSALGALVETGGCRRAILLRHFGESPPENCGNCDNCQSPPAFSDATELARKLLSAVYRTGQSYGLAHIERVLTGKADDRIVQQQHDRLSVFSIVPAEEAPLIKPVSRALLVRDALRTTEHGGLMLGPDARAILKGDCPVEIALLPRRTSRKQARGGDHPPNPIFDALRACRRDLAAEAGVPPYVIFHDATLREMAQIRPRSLRDMALVSGVGERKLEAYGEAFLAVLKQF